MNFPAGPSSAGVSSLAIHQDPGGSNNKLFWTRRLAGEVNRSNPDGSDPELIVSDQYDAQQIVVDSTNGKIYWSVPQESVVRRADLDGSNVEDFISGVEVVDLDGLCMPALRPG